MQLLYGELTDFLYFGNAPFIVVCHVFMYNCRYLATGDQILSISLAYRIGESTCSAVIKETCALLMQVLAPIYVKAPTKEDWVKIANGFWNEWNFPNCIGAIDGKHIYIQAPPNSGSLYYNYKKTFSIVLMAVCDENYKFTLVDVGEYGSNHDAGVFARSEFGESFSKGELNIPEGQANLPGSETKVPFFFVADDAFQLSKNMMKPYPGRNLNKTRKVFNYRISRARRMIENSFGILVSRWRVFRKPICMHPEAADKIVMATICLHNYLKTINDQKPAINQTYCPALFVDTELSNGNIVPGQWRQDETSAVGSIRPTPAHRATVEAHRQRDCIADYLLTPAGAVKWQETYVHRGLNAPDFPENNN